MAQCALNPHEFVQNAFNPVVAVLCTEKAEEICHKNNLSFVEMVQPFCKLNTEAHLRDPANQTYTVRNLRITLNDMNSEPPKPLVARKMLYEAIANTVPNYGDSSRTRTLKTAGYSIQINNTTPWFEAYRDCFLRVAPFSDHEFLSHFLACIFVVAASDSDPLQEFAKLSHEQQNHQQQSANKPTKWFFPVALRYYVLLHDVIELDQMKTETLFKTLQGMYGATNCHLLQINSRNPRTAGGRNVEESQANLPDPWSQFLTRKPDSEMSEFDPNSPSFLHDEIEKDKTDIWTADNDPIIMTGEEDNLTDYSTVSVIDHPLMPHLPPDKETYSDFSIRLKEEHDGELTSVNGYKGSGFASTPSDMCLKLTTNSVTRASSTPNMASGKQQRSQSIQHGMHLTLGDVEHLRLFVQEFCMKALLPFVEKQMNMLHEAVTNRKGLHRSFFSATKKWFGGSKPAPVAANVPTSSVFYSPDAVELQVRRLGDLAFMFQNFELAYHAYHNVKRDFNSDQAWMHFAGSLEMAALSVFMQGTLSQRQLPFHYFDSAVSTYLNTCKSPHFATRTTLLGAECLKYYDRHLDAASYFIRMTSEESDLRSALLLEQAAHCFANLKIPCIRKYAFYMILAGHRYNKAGQKKHSLRSYKQALQVYEGQQWLLAEDHINLTAGRLNFSLNQLEDAMACFHRLLYDGSLQCVTQQAYYLREYLAICSHLWGANGSLNERLPHLPLPVIDSQNCKVLLGDRSECQFDTLGSGCTLQSEEEEEENECLDDVSRGDESVWHHLEQMAVVEAFGSVPVNHKPMLYWCSSATDNTQHPIAIVDEQVTVELNLRNPLKVPLCMTNMRLLWSFRHTDSDESSSVTNEDPKWNPMQQSDVIETKVLDDVFLDSMQSQNIDLVVIPHRLGKVQIQGIAYNLTTNQGSSAVSALNLNNGTGSNDSPPISSNSITSFAVSGMQPLKVIGPRLNNTKTEKCGQIYRDDRRLEPVVVTSMPRLTVKQHHFPTSLLCGQVAPVIFEFHNRGQVGLSRLLLATSLPHLLAFGPPSFEAPQINHKVYSSQPAPFLTSSANYWHDSSGVFSIPLPQNVALLQPGQRFWIPAWIRGPEPAGNHSLHLLFYYETAAAQEEKQNKHTLRHRVFRCQAKLQTTNVLSASAIAISGANPTGDSFSRSLTVAVEAANLQQDCQLELSQISCISHSWMMEPMDQLTSGNVVIGTKETVHLCFRAVQKNTSCSFSGNDTRQLHFSNVIFKGNEKRNVRLEFGRKCDVSVVLNMANAEIGFKPRNPSSTDRGRESVSEYHHHVERVQLDNLKWIWGVLQINSSVTPSFDFYQRGIVVRQKNNKLEDSEENCCEYNENKEGSKCNNSAIISLVVFWEALFGNGDIVCGQHHLTLNKVDVFVTTSPETKPIEDKPPVRFVTNVDNTAMTNELDDALLSSSQLLKYFIFANSLVKHDFCISRMCVVPVFLVLYNCVDLEVIATVNTGRLSPSEPLTTSPEANRFVWIGLTRVKLTLKPQETKVVRLKAGFFGRGAYMLNGVDVYARPHSGEEETLQNGVGQIVIVGREASENDGI